MVFSWDANNRETSELGGEGVAVCLKGLIISWVFTPVLGEHFGWGSG